MYIGKERVMSRIKTDGAIYGSAEKIVRRKFTLFLFQLELLMLLLQLGMLRTQPMMLKQESLVQCSPGFVTLL